MKISVALTIALVSLTTACANPARELKAPCGPLTSYADDDQCGEAKPVNTAFAHVVVE